MKIPKSSPPLTSSSPPSLPPNPHDPLPRVSRHNPPLGGEAEVKAESPTSDYGDETCDTTEAGEAGEGGKVLGNRTPTNTSPKVSLKKNIEIKS